jgi:hypothetical protein
MWSEKGLVKLLMNLLMRQRSFYCIVRWMAWHLFKAITSFTSITSLSSTNSNHFFAVWLTIDWYKIKSFFVRGLRQEMFHTVIQFQHKLLICIHWLSLASIHCCERILDLLVIMIGQFHYLYWFTWGALATQIRMKETSWLSSFHHMALFRLTTLSLLPIPHFEYILLNCIGFLSHQRTLQRFVQLSSGWLAYFKTNISNRSTFYNIDFTWSSFNKRPLYFKLICVGNEYLYTRFSSTIPPLLVNFQSTCLQYHNHQNINGTN